MSDINNNGQENAVAAVPFAAVKMDRDLLWYLFLSIVTFGVYSIIFWTKMTNDVNLIATQRDGKHTMHYCLMFFLLTPITLGIYNLYWMHGFSQRVGDEARARGISTDFGASTFWLWSILGSVVGVGRLVYLYKLISTMNFVSMSYNQNGK